MVHRHGVLTSSFRKASPGCLGRPEVAAVGAAGDVAEVVPSTGALGVAEVLVDAVEGVDAVAQAPVPGGGQRRSCHGGRCSCQADQGNE